MYNFEEESLPIMPEQNSDTVTTSSESSHNASTEVEEPAEWVYHKTSTKLHLAFVEISPEAVCRNLFRPNTYQQVLVLDC